MNIRESANQSLDKLRKALCHYAGGRKAEHYVGQFLDKEGLRSPQFGVYGMSTWLSLTAEDSEWPDAVISLREACKEKLRGWVLEAKDKTITELSSNPDDAPYELHRIAPKTAAAFHALLRENDAADAATVLQNFICQSQLSNGAWGHLLDEERGDAVVTALVLRAIQESPSCTKQKRDALKFLIDEGDEVNDLYKRLYVYNTILLVGSQVDIIKKTKEKIVETIKSIYASARLHPIRYPNPVNIDFHDIHRVRYFRLPSDIILLESLILLSRENLRFVQAHAGRRILQDLVQCLSDRDLEKDMSGHRLSLSAVHYYTFILGILSKSSVGPTRFFGRVIGAAKSSFLFGMDYSLDLLVFLSAIGISITAHNLDQLPIFNVAVGVVFKSAIDLLKALYDFYKGRH